MSLVVNVEEGAELTLSAGDERNESRYEVVDEVVGAVDPCMESHFEYGTRAGYWRIMALLARFGVPATVSACARALEQSPWLARDALARGHEIACHGYRWESHAGMSEPVERAVIARAVETITRVAGVRPVGWHTRSASSVNTRRLLVEEGGFRYDSDAYDDDLPYLVQVGGRPHVVIPYSFDTNDMRFQAGGGFTLARDFAAYVTDAFDWLWREGESAPKPCRSACTSGSSAARAGSAPWSKSSSTSPPAARSGSPGATRSPATGARSTGSRREGGCP